MLKYSHPWLASIIHHWPATVLLPSVLLLVAVLASSQGGGTAEMRPPRRSRRRYDLTSTSSRANQPLRRRTK